jgi:hypothetical protein
MTALVSLEIYGTAEQHLGDLKNIKNLRKLSIGRHMVSELQNIPMDITFFEGVKILPVDIQLLGQFTNLTDLRLYPKKTLEESSFLVPLKNLRELMLINVKIGGPEFPELPKLEKMVFDCENAEFGFLQRLKTLKCLTCTNISQEILEKLPNLQVFCTPLETLTTLVQLREGEEPTEKFKKMFPNLIFHNFFYRK